MEKYPQENWFTIEKIDSSTFAVSEYKHWEETHCYLLCGSERALLIDTGLGVSNIKQAVESLTGLPVEVATTHIHWDHIGGHKFFDNISVYEAEAEWLNGKFPISLQMVKQNLMRAPCAFPPQFSLENYQIYQGKPNRILYDGDLLSLGDRHVRVIHTPGHSPGHCCFYEAERGYLYSGDLIYQGCLNAFYPSTDPQLFWESVKKIQKLKVKLILPGHHRISIPVDIINDIENAFRSLSDEKKLKQGNGIFYYGKFQIHI